MMSTQSNDTAEVLAETEERLLKRWPRKECAEWSTGQLQSGLRGC